jgi:hypothetical protein
VPAGGAEIKRSSVPGATLVDEGSGRVSSAWHRFAMTRLMEPQALS